MLFPNQMKDIKDLNQEELGKVLKDWGAPVFHSRQIFIWIYQKNARDFSSMSDLPQELRKKLGQDLYIFGSKLVKEAASRDGTEKFLFELKDRQRVEAVRIPAKGRVTACLSTQAGCKFGCGFCASGLKGFERNLSAGEIIEQALYLKNAATDKKITHVVFMGTGEPLDNYDAVLKAIRIINSDYSLHIGARRMTISTCGIIPGIRRLAEENLQVELSVSLHASDDETRARLMPINKKYPLKDLLKVCKEYMEKTGRQVTFEYVLIKGVNSDLQNAGNLSKILSRLRLAKVNLIPSNSIKELHLEPPSRAETALFRGQLIKQGIPVTLRRERGEDIEAACGQLRLRYEKSSHKDTRTQGHKATINIIVAVCLSAVLWAGCAKREIKNIDSKGTQIICFGDSITFGYGVNPGEDYPTELSKLIQRPVINAGVDGDTTAMALKRIQLDVLDKDPRLVIIEFAGNDFLKKVPQEETVKNLREMVALVQARGAMVALVDISAGMFFAEYRKLYKRIADETGCIFVPHILNGIITNPSMKSDFMHPNVEGYKIVAQRILNVIKPYL
jgi:23S rRNA (adenine2503-C2)-methyltransferase